MRKNSKLQYYSTTVTVLYLTYYNSCDLYHSYIDLLSEIARHIMTEKTSFEYSMIILLVSFVRCSYLIRLAIP